jgi:hypothetical protein
VSRQKGGMSYLQREECMIYGKIYYYKNLGLTFPIQSKDGSSYVILREEECKNFREKML